MFLAINLVYIINFFIFVLWFKEKKDAKFLTRINELTKRKNQPFKNVVIWKIRTN